jgi:putative transcriptional regulator
MKNKIRVLRKQNKLTQSQLAKQCQVSRQTINMIENDHYDPTLKLALKLSEVLGVTVNDLFNSQE